MISPPVPSSIANVLLFVAVGMIWSAARLFHGRPVRWGAMFLGATVWLAASMLPAFAASAAARVVVSSLIVASYTFLIAAELWRERRKALIRRWPAIFVPMLHGAIFLLPMVLASLSLDHGGFRSLSTGLGCGLCHRDRALRRRRRLHRAGAGEGPHGSPLQDGSRDRSAHRPFEPPRVLRGRSGAHDRQCHAKAPVSVLAFDLDHFKSINDRFGHDMGDAMLQLFAAVARKTMRANDVIGRLGGEEFVAILSGTLADGTVAAERVRVAFEAATRAPNGHQIPATVSIGVACGSPHCRDRDVDRARRCRALLCQGERPQPGRDGR